jgi:hypothetical protein
MECGMNSVAQQWLRDQHVQLVTAVSGRTHLRSLGERHSQEAASQLPHHHFLRLVTMGSNSEFKGVHVP